MYENADFVRACELIDNYDWNSLIDNDINESVEKWTINSSWTNVSQNSHLNATGTFCGLQEVLSDTFMKNEKVRKLTNLNIVRMLHE